MSKKHEFPELYLYRELTSSEQMAIHQMLISYVREENSLSYTKVR